jgi:hypothetical protein
MLTRSLLVFCALTLPTTACLVEDKGPEDEAPGEDGKFDSQRSPIDHGAIAFEVKVDAVLTDTERFHAWQFELSADADVELVTSYTVLGQRKTDTVLYLYRETPSSPTGWGPYIARNDDYDGKVYSKITESLTAGRYRALVKGYTLETRGKFSLIAHCSGAGCEPAAPADECLFGGTFFELPEVEGLIVNPKIELTSAAGLSDLDRARIVLAMQQSSHTDVTTAEEAFERADQHEINKVNIYDLAGARSFVAFEYGAGDNSYGAIFEGRSAVLVSSIHDGDLLECTAIPQTCLYGQSYFEMRSNPAWTLTASRVATSPADLAGIELDQALRAVQEAYAEAATIEAAFEAVDGSEINVRSYRHATGVTADVFEYGAGDNSYGQIFRAGTIELGAAINDGDLYACSVFAE